MVEVGREMVEVGREMVEVGRERDNTPVLSSFFVSRGSCETDASTRRLIDLE